MMRGGPESHTHNVGSGPSVNHSSEPAHRGREYTTSERAAIQERLGRHLGPEWISSRPGPGGTKLYHLTVQRAVELANEVFGFDGWSSSIINTTVDYAIQDPETRRFNVGVSIIVRVTLRNGAFHEDMGYGTAENSKNMAMGFEHAKKSGASDALKRALKNFGNVLGNCIYDKDYLKQVTKMRVHPTKLDLNKLHRHPEFAPVQQQPSAPAAPAPAPVAAIMNNVAKPTSNALVSKPDTSVMTDSFDDEFGGFDIEDFGLGDESIYDHDAVALPPDSPTKTTAPARTSTVAAPAVNGTSRPTTDPGHSVSGRLNQGQMPELNASRPAPQAERNLSRQPSGASRTTTPQPPAQPPNTSNATRPPQSYSGPGRVLNQPSRIGPAAVIVPPAPQVKSANPENGTTGGETPEPVGFFSARAAMSSTSESEAPVDASLTFNPNSESPSIRKTPGIDHSKSKPLTKQLRHLPGVVRDGGSPVGNVVNPQLDGARRIGAPHSPSPLANRGSYKPPTMAMKRNIDGSNANVDATRPPLTDLPANEKLATGDGTEAKRPRRTP